jgi:hypothetical protein
VNLCGNHYCFSFSIYYFLTLYYHSILNEGGELAASTCVKESTSCLCDGTDMSDFVNQNAVGYINNLSENDLDQFIDSSYERYEATLKESTQNNGDAALVMNDIAKLEQDGLKQDGMMNAQGAFDASTKNLKFNLVLEEQVDEEEGDEDEGDEDEGDEDEGDEDEGDEDEGDEEVAGKDGSDESSEKEDKADAGKDDDKKDTKGEGSADDESKDTEKKPVDKALERAQDPFCQTFLSRCNDDCSASQAE